MSIFRKLRKAQIGTFGNSVENRLNLFGCYVHFYFFDHGWIRAIYDNYFVIDEKLHRSSHPSYSTLKKAASLGVTQVISLRHPGKISYQLLEEIWTDRLGLKFVSYSMSASDISDPSTYLNILDQINNNRGKTLIHCKSGADRSGLVSALYLLNQSMPQIQKSLQMLNWKFGHFGLGEKAINKKFLHLVISIISLNNNKTFQQALIMASENIDQCTRKRG